MAATRDPPFLITPIVAFLVLFPLCYCCLSFLCAEVVIGFERTMYFTNESSREVVITVLLYVWEGDLELGRTVEIQLGTMDGTALSKPQLVMQTVSEYYSGASKYIIIGEVCASELFLYREVEVKFIMH